MPRKKTFTLVRIDTNGKAPVLDYEQFDDADKLKSALAKIEENEAETHVLFASPPVKFSISREPTVQIGEARGRKPRKAKDAKAPRKTKAAGTVVQPEFFEKPANGAKPAPVFEPDDAPTEQE